MRRPRSTTRSRTAGSLPSMGTHEVMLTGLDRFIEEALAFIREEN